jgi:PAS domain S-box-containing protein
MPVSAIPDLDRHAFDSIHDAVIVIDERGRIDLFNLAAAEMFGYAPREILGHNVSMLMPEPDRSRHDSYLRRYLDTRESRIIGVGRDVEGRRKDGGTFPLWLCVSELHRLEGRRRFIGTLRDITQRMRIEEALQLSETRYRHAQQLASLAHWMDIPQPGGQWADSRIEFSSEADAIFGVSESSLPILNQDFLDLIVHPEDRARVAEQFKDVYENRVAHYTQRYRIVRPDGQVRVIQEIGEVVLGDDGQVDRVIGVDQDITDQIRIEEALKASEIQHQRAHRIARLGHWLWRPSENESWHAATVTFSDSIAELFGVAPAQLAVSNADFIEIFVIPEDRPAVRKAFESIGDTSASSYMVEYRVLRPDGRLIAVEEVGEIERNATGQIKAVSGTIQDITWRRQLEDDLREAVKSAEAANRAKSAFLSHMSHELRTPLNAVIGFAQAMQEGVGGVPSKTHLSYLQDIESSGLHLLDIINDMLDLSKLEAGRMELAEGEIDCHDLLMRCLSLVMTQADTKNLEVTLDVPSPPPTVRGDELALKKVLVNLLSNAVKFTPPGGQVTLSARITPEGGLDFAVSDTGVSMRPEEIPAALQPFRSQHNTYQRSREGTGLGLPLARSLIELHGGRLEIVSELGKGTTVTARLPAERVL